MRKGAIWPQVFIMIVVTLVIIGVIRWFLKEMFRQEGVIGDMSASNYKLINTERMVEIYMKQYFKFTSIKVAKDVTGGDEPDWNRIFSDQTLLDQFKTKLEEEFAPVYTARFETEIGVNKIEVSNRKITLDYHVIVIGKYRGLEQDEQIILEV